MFPPMRRVKQGLSREACVDVLLFGKRGVLALSGNDGYPYAVPMNYWYDQDKNLLYFHCAREGHKIDSVQRSDKVSFNVLSDPWSNDGEWWSRFDSVIAFGRMSKVEDREVKNQALHSLAKKHYSSEEQIAQEVKAAEKACVLQMTVEHLTGKRIQER